MKKKTLLIGLSLTVLSLNGHTKDIVQFGDSDLMEIFDTAEAVTATNAKINIPKPPVKILAEKGSRYAFKVDSKTYWVEGVDVETSERVQIESLCNSTQLATDYKSNHYGIRGAGIGCKK